jgi:hypothetical protein
MNLVQRLFHARDAVASTHSELAQPDTATRTVWIVNEISESATAIRGLSADLLAARVSGDLAKMSVVAKTMATHIVQLTMMVETLDKVLGNDAKPAAGAKAACPHNFVDPDWCPDCCR